MVGVSVNVYAMVRIMPFSGNRQLDNRRSDKRRSAKYIPGWMDIKAVLGLIYFAIFNFFLKLRVLKFSLESGL